VQKEKKAKKDKDNSEEEDAESSDDEAAAAEKAAKKAEKAAASAAAAASASASASAAPAAPAGAKSLIATGSSDSDESDSESDDESGDGEAGSSWHTDTSKAAQKTRADAEFREMLAGTRKDVEKIMLDAKADNKADAPVTILKIFLASKPGGRSPQEIAAELRRLAMSRGLDEPQKMKILLESIIDISTPKTVVEQFRAKQELLKYFTKQNNVQQQQQQAAGVSDQRAGNAANMLLTCIEDLIGVVERKLLPAAPLILQALYEEEVLEEPTLLAWYDAPPEASWLVNKDVAAEVRAKAKPFIEWLRTAESDEEDEE
jgi:translation initiation factor 5